MTFAILQHEFIRILPTDRIPIPIIGTANDINLDNALPSSEFRVTVSFLQTQPLQKRLGRLLHRADPETKLEAVLARPISEQDGTDSIDPGLALRVQEEVQQVRVVPSVWGSTGSFFIGAPIPKNKLSERAIHIRKI